MGKKLFVTMIAGLFLMTGIAFAEVAPAPEADDTAVQTQTVAEDEAAKDATETPVVEKAAVEEETTES